MKIAVLMASHNRRALTVRCLRGLLSQGRDLDVCLVDDGSSDGTAEAVEREFGRVRLIRGDGSLYWARAMELAWKTSLRQGEYDGFLWLNDDVEIAPNALARLRCLCAANPEAVVVGELANAAGEIVYGTRGDLFTGNFVFVPRGVSETVGLICGDYCHAWADSDYALRCRRRGVPVVSCGVVGRCEGHPNRPCLKGLSFRERWASLWDPKGWCVRDVWLYRRRNWGLWAAIASSAHLVLHVLKGERR